MITFKNNYLNNCAIKTNNYLCIYKYFILDINFK
jgi:hypothetical protein